MIYTLGNKNINIPEKELEQLMPLCETRQEAIELWLDDHDYTENEEQNELDEKAKTMKIQHGAKAEDTAKADRKARTVKTSDAKKELFADIFNALDRLYEGVSIVKENKLIQIEFDDKVFKLDLVETRQKK